MKTRFERVRRIVFWSFLSLAMLIGAGWIFSAVSGVRYTFRTSNVPLSAISGLQWVLYPTATFALIEGQFFYAKLPGVIPEEFVVASNSWEREVMHWELTDLVASVNAVGPPLPIPLTVVVVPLWMPLAGSLAISTLLWAISLRVRPRPSADAPIEFTRRKRATWKRAAISLPFLIGALIGTPFLMVLASEAFFPRIDVFNELRRRYDLSEQLLLGVVLAIWLALSYCVARIAFAVTAWTRVRIFGDGHRPCEECGYDLMGNVSGICPECGTAIGASEIAGK